MLVIFHKGCPDGWCAAYLVKKQFPEAVLHGMAYGEPVPWEAMVGHEVLLMVDFSFKRPQMIEILDKIPTVTIYDHHQTAQKELEGLQEQYPHSTIVFDMNRSGATITYDELYGVLPRTWFVNYVEDRDLWRHALPKSREVNAYLMTLPQIFYAWDQLNALDWEEAARRGEGALSHVKHYVEKIVANHSKGSLGMPEMNRMFTVGIVNAPYPNCSEVGNVLSDQYDVGMSWFERNDGIIQFSFRSKQGSDVDVSTIAKTLGGGGHKHAAGAELPIKEGRKLIDSIIGR
jgi:oligoribonuclease NrnB/cAMP/cGMP phosphodiesterase (DHH superfamily)